MNQDTTAEGKVRTPPSVADVMRTIGRDARAAALALSLTSTDQKNCALRAAAASLRARRHEIIAANDRDMREAAAKGLSPALLDRLKLDEKRVEAMAHGLDDIAQLADPIGTVLAEWTRPNGMKIQRVRVPLGVIGIIYESRPNVTADAGALCLKSSNAVILRGGTESTHSSAAIHSCLDEGLTVAGLPGSCIQLVPTTDRAAVGYMLAEMVDDIDVIVPRGGKSLIARVQQEARVPVIGHLEGVCHVYVDRAADLGMAKDILLNAKLRRTGVCGSAETLLVDRACAATHLPALVGMLLEDLRVPFVRLAGDGRRPVEKRVVELLDVVDTFHEEREVLELRPLVVGGRNGDVDLDRLVDRARRGTAGEADVRPRAFARLHRYRCGTTDSDRDEQRIAQIVAALPLDAAPGVLEIPRHLADLALQLRIGAESRHGCDEANPPGGATPRNGAVADGREKFFAEFPVFCERRGEIGRAGSALLQCL